MSLIKTQTHDFGISTHRHFKPPKKNGSHSREHFNSRRKEGKPEAKEPEGKTGPRQCFEVHVARVWTRQDGKLSAGTNGDLCLPRQLQISSLPLVILIGAPSWGLFIPLMPYGASGDQQQQVLLMADRARQAEHSKREEQEGTHSQTEACSLHPVLRVVASISRESYTALKKSCELCCEKS